MSSIVRRLRRFARSKGIRGYGPPILEHLYFEVEAASQDGRCFSAKCEDIASALGYGLSTVRRWLGKFEALGLLKRGRNWCRAFVHGVMCVCRLADSYVLTFEVNDEADQFASDAAKTPPVRAALAVRRVVSTWTTGELHKLAEKARNVLFSAEALTLSGLSKRSPYPDLFSPSEIADIGARLAAKWSEEPRR